MSVKIMSHEGSAISVELPDTVTMEVVEADAVVKGQAASSSFKPAILENGIRVLVPPHIESGTHMLFDHRTRHTLSEQNTKSSTL